MSNTRTKTPTARPVDARESLPRGDTPGLKVWLFNNKIQKWCITQALTVRMLHHYSSERIYWAPITPKEAS